MATTTHERAGDERAFVGAGPTPEGDGIDDAAPADAGPRSARAAHSLSGLAARWPKRSLNRSLKRRLVRGRQEDAPWVRPALLVVLTMAALLYLWDLGDSGWANSFYAAAVQAGTKSWKAFFFGSFDSSNFITVDKPPASLWVMELSARLFGLNSWSILVPQALEGVAAVGVLYAAVRRWASPGAGLVAAGVMAVTPVATLMFRYNNPDALLVLLLCGAAYATTVATQKGSRSWLMVAFALVGIGFITKMLQAYLVVPAMAVTFLVAAPGRTPTRVRQLVAGGTALVVSSGWWVVAVMLVPARDRPYIGGSQDNSLWNLIFGYNGLGRLTGNESGSVGGGGALTTGRWGATGLTRLFGSEMGSRDLLAPACGPRAARSRPSRHLEATAHGRRPGGPSPVGRLACGHGARLQPRTGDHPPLLQRRAGTRHRRGRGCRRSYSLGSENGPLGALDHGRHRDVERGMGCRPA